MSTNLHTRAVTILAYPYVLWQLRTSALRSSTTVSVIKRLISRVTGTYGSEEEEWGNPSPRTRQTYGSPLFWMEHWRHDGKTDGRSMTLVFQ
jgi:hypothetical protein